MVNMIHNGKQVLRDIRARRSVWGRSTVLAVFALVLIVALVVVTGTADYQNCIQINVC